MSEADDSVLVEKARAGDVAAFEQLLLAHEGRIFSLARNMMKSDADAAEVMQDAFLAAFRALPNYRGEAAFGTWLHRIAANEALMRLRKNRRTSQVETSLEGPQFNERGSLLDEVADWTPNAEALTLDAELRTIIEGASQSLPDEHREAFLLRDIEGLPYETIAEMTNQTVGNVKTRIHRARLAMRAAIDAFYQDGS